MNDLATGPAAFRVLVVDDDQDMAAFLARMLAQQGLKAEIVTDGYAALAAIAADPPDLVLLDVQMPGPDGFEICRRLKASESGMILRSQRSPSLFLPLWTTANPC